eukprot:4115936-Pyramimonas_sp.AAC.1
MIAGQPTGWDQDPAALDKLRPEEVSFERCFHIYGGPDYLEVILYQPRLILYQPVVLSAYHATPSPLLWFESRGPRRRGVCTHGAVGLRYRRHALIVTPSP